MGGVWFGNNMTDHPTLWQQAFPPEITTSLVTYDNLHGTISNSDLELAGHIAHNNMLASIANIGSMTVASYTDNTPALYWTKKGFTSTSVPAAYLLRLQALHQWHYGYHNRTVHIAGTANVMADDCSWPWHLIDEQLLTHYNSYYPQSLPWQQCTLQPEMHSALLFALQRKQQPPELFLLQLQQPKHGSGLSGWQSAQSKWEINPIQDPSTTQTSNYLVAFIHKGHTGKSLPVENCANLET